MSRKSTSTNCDYSDNAQTHVAFTPWISDIISKIIHCFAAGLRRYIATQIHMLRSFAVFFIDLKLYKPNARRKIRIENNVFINRIDVIALGDLTDLGFANHMRTSKLAGPFTLV